MKKLLPLFIGMQLYAALHAQSNFKVNNICDTLVVDFTDSSQGLTVYFIDQTTTDGGLSVHDRVWLFGDSLSAPNDTSAALDPVHTFTAPGTYQVCLAIHALLAGNPGSEIHCYDTTCKFITVVASGINDIAEAGMNLYPNPSKGMVRIAGLPADKGLVEVADAYGRKIPVEVQNNSLIIIPGGYPNGIYFVAVTVDDRLLTRKFLLNR